MLRPFNPEDLDRNKDYYERISDIILRPLSSAAAAAAAAQETPSPTEKYDKPFLSNLTNLADEPTDTIGEDTAEDALEAERQDALETQRENEKFDREFNPKNRKDENILAMIFKIIPIGINIAKRGKTISTGFKRLATGIADLLKNLAILTPIILMDNIRHTMELFIYLFKVLQCSVKIISQFPKCFIFYLVEISIIILLIFAISPLFIIDMLFGVKHFTGQSLVERFLDALDSLEQMDRTIYSAFSFHIIHYPDSIINMCYRCDAMGDTSGYEQIKRKLFRDIFIDLPNGIGTPIGKIFSGIGNIFSFLKI